MLGVGGPGGTNRRPRRCDAVGEAGAEGLGDEVTTLRGIVAGFGVEVATGVVVCGAVGVEAAEVVPPPVTGGVAFSGAAARTNFFGGALGGGVASDFIFSRVLFASS